MIRDPETYEELIRYKRCVDLTKYYELTESQIEKIYDFLESDKEGKIKSTGDYITLYPSTLNFTNEDVIIARCINSSIDGILMTNTMLEIIPHYTPSSGGSSYSGGSSSNNSNNNNNNNNNNNR